MASSRNWSGVLGRYVVLYKIQYINVAYTCVEGSPSADGLICGRNILALDVVQLLYNWSPASLSTISKADQRYLRFRPVIKEQVDCLVITWENWVGVTRNHALCAVQQEIEPTIWPGSHITCTLPTFILYHKHRSVFKNACRHVVRLRLRGQSDVHMHKYFGILTFGMPCK